jgi:hypothetical protein
MAVTGQEQEYNKVLLRSTNLLIAEEWVSELLSITDQIEHFITSGRLKMMKDAYKSKINELIQSYIAVERLPTKGNFLSQLFFFASNSAESMIYN